MDRKPWRQVLALVLMCLISLSMVTRTSGFENIRTVQFLLIFIGGMCGGAALGFLRAARKMPGDKPGTL